MVIARIPTALTVHSVGSSTQSNTCNPRTPKIIIISSFNWLIRCVDFETRGCRCISRTVGIGEPNVLTKGGITKQWPLISRSVRSKLFGLLDDVANTLNNVATIRLNSLSDGCCVYNG